MNNHIVQHDRDFDDILRTLTSDVANTFAISVSSPLIFGSITQFDPCYRRGVMARRVVKRSNARSTGKFPSWKMDRMIEFESLYELAAFQYLECNPSVKHYWAQPCKIQYRDGEAECLHYPDICVDFGTHKELWEIKPESELDDTDLIRRTRLLTPLLLQRGYVYRVIGGEILRRQPFYSNQRLLLRHRIRTVSVAHYEQLRVIAKQTTTLTWREASAGKYGKNGRGILSSLAIIGHLKIDLSQKIETDAVFRFEEQ
jgi:hypothetical protein